jgi:hypothetical protein
VVEHWTENPRVVGSIPALSKILFVIYYFYIIFSWKIYVDSKILSLLGEMVDALDLKFSSFKSIGSSPIAGIFLLREKK